MTEPTNQIMKYKENLDPNNLKAISEYGFDIQEELGRSATELSSRIKVSDADEVGQQLVALKTQMSSIQLGNTNSSGLQGLVQKYIKKGKLNLIQYQAQRDSVAVSVNKIAENLQDTANQLKSDCDVATSIADDARQYGQRLEEAIAELNNATQQVQEELKSTDDEDRKMQLNRALDIMIRRKNNLLSSQAMASQQYNSMQILISGNYALIEDMHTAIHTTIPNWRSQLNVAAIIHRQDVSGRVKEILSNTTNEMLKSTSESLKISSIRIANEANRPVVDMDTITHVQNEMIETISKVSDIYNKSTLINTKNIEKLEEFKAQNEKASKSIGYLDVDLDSNNK